MLLRAAAIPAPAWPGSGCRGARQRVTAMATAPLPEHPALIACPEKPATGAEKEEVKGWGGDFG